MIHLITYGDKKYNKSKQRLLYLAKDSDWFETITSYGPDNLDPIFKIRFKEILSCPRGGGYWTWKPFLIQKKLQEIKDGDFLIYLDAGCTINKNAKKRFDEYIEMLDKSEKGILSFQMTHPEKYYTTKEIFSYFNCETNEEILNSGQIVGGIQVIKKNEHSLKLIDIWVKALYDDPLLFTDYYNNKNQDECFKDNRHDQSVFSVIKKLHGALIIPDESNFLPYGKGKCLDYPFWATRVKLI